MLKSSNTKPHVQSIINALKQGADPHVIALDLLESGLKDGHYEKSVANCHTQGVDSIVLYDETATNQGMIRFYFAHHDKQQLHTLISPEGHFTVGIHNHRYEIAKISLNEDLYNVRTSVSDCPTSLQMYEYEFRSALKDGGQAGLSSAIRRDMEPVQFDLLHPGQVSVMKATDLHTMQIPRAQTAGTAWMVIEGPATNNQSLLYSPRPDLALDTQELYKPVGNDYARALIEQVIELTKASSVS